MSWLKDWWEFVSNEALSSADKPHVTLRHNQRYDILVITVICGLIGTIVGLGIYVKFMVWNDLLTSIAPPLIGLLLVEFCILRKREPFENNLTNLPNCKPVALAAYLMGVGGAFFVPEWAAKALVGLFIYVIAYWAMSFVVSGERRNPKELTVA